MLSKALTHTISNIAPAEQSLLMAEKSICVGVGNWRILKNFLNAPMNHNNKKSQMVAYLYSTARRYSLGIEVEVACGQLRKLVEQGLPTIPPKCEKPWWIPRNWIANGKRWNRSTCSFVLRLRASQKQKNEN